MKHYLSETIGDGYYNWDKKKVIISAGTGFGKTYFIIVTYLKHVASGGGKLLILCNRRLLRVQYWYDLITHYLDGRFLEKYVVVMTYQQMEEEMSHSKDRLSVIRDYTAIIFDEAHYFYSDSDFNGFGTYLLLNELIQLCFKKTLIFMSATIEPVEPFIRAAIERARCNQKGRYIIQNSSYRRVEESYEELHRYSEITYVSHCQVNEFSHFNCVVLDSEKALTEYIALSNMKSILFIDDKKKAEQIKKAIVEYNTISEKEIVIINADNLNNVGNNHVIETLTISHKIEPRVLITTSVLDNGVSIHDEDVGNLLIITDSKTSFMQMVGRVRNESCKTCNLLFMLRDSSEFKDRMNNIEEELKVIDQIIENNHLNSACNYRVAWDDDNPNSSLYRKMLLPISDTLMDEFILHPYSDGKRKKVKGMNLVLNEYAERKTRDMYMQLSRFYSMAVKNPLSVVRYQMSWLGKEPNDFEYYIPQFNEMMENKIKEILLTVFDLNTEDYSAKKDALTKEFFEYIKKYFEKTLRKDRPITQKTVEDMCDKLGLCYKKGIVNGVTRHSIVRKEEEYEREITNK